jgi:hypothetical protein
MTSQNNLVRFIGDVHGYYDRYRELIRNIPESIQVGDLGVGFRRVATGEEYSNPPHYAMVQGKHRFIRGNHDNPGACRRHSQYIPDGTIEGDVMFVGGATSIDKAFRVEDYSWWRDEELSIEALYEITDKYLQAKPRVMVTHECPEAVAELMLNEQNKTKWYDPSRTRQAFNAMWEMHKPELWIFGHWHRSWDQVVLGTRFICLAELEHKDLEI